MPAMARRSVLLPEPDGPLTSSLSPGATAASIPLIKVRPSGRPRSSFSISRSSPRASPIAMPAPSAPAASALAIAWSKLIKRSTLALLVYQGRIIGRTGGVDVDKPGERSLHLAESIRGLGQDAEGDDAGEVVGRSDDIGKDTRERAVETDEPVEPLVQQHGLVPIGDHLGESIPEPSPLVGFTAIE